MPTFHKQLAAGKWFTLSLVEQLAHVGSEVERALRWREKGDKATSWLALERALELLDLTIVDPRWQGRRRELTRTREILVDFFTGNEYHSSPESFQSYFLSFAYAARRGKG